MIEIPPKFAGRPPVNPEARKDKSLFQKTWRGAQGLAEDVRYYGKWMRDEAEKRIGHLYPKVKIPPIPPFEKGGWGGFLFRASGPYQVRRERTHRHRLALGAYCEKP